MSVLRDDDGMATTRGMLEDSPWFQAWAALCVLGFFVQIIVNVVTSGNDVTVLKMLPLAPIFLTLAATAAFAVGACLFFIARPFLPRPPHERIPLVDMRAVPRGKR